MKTFMKTSGLFALLLLATSAFAQSIGFGGRIGTNLANVDIEGGGITLETDSKAGLNIALLLKFGISENFSVQPEVNFMQKGYRLELDFFDEKVESKVTFNYFEVPILAKLSFGPELIQGFVQGGPSFGFAMSGTTETDGEKEDIDFDEDGFKRGEVSFIIGGGVGFNIGPGQLFVDARYLLGFSDIYDADADEGSVKNRGIGVGVGFIVNIGK
ncbi:MAG: PorT family protein [Bacteroidetes bacterium]|nr:PorT family protein [Bacteroidota bacterium]